MIEIIDWCKHFETAKSRDYKTLPWVAMPVKLNGSGYLRMLSEKNGESLYGCWCALVLLAASGTKRGTITHSVRGIAMATHFSESTIEKTLQVSQDLGWVLEESLRSPSGVLEESLRSPLRNEPNEPNITERRGKPKHPAAKDAAVTVYEFYNSEIRKSPKADSIRHITKLLKTGLTAEKLIQYAKNYVANDSPNPGYEYQANNFYGRAEHWKTYADTEPLKPPAEKREPETPEQKQARVEREAAWAEKAAGYRREVLNDLQNRG